MILEVNQMASGGVRMALRQIDRLFTAGTAIGAAETHLLDRFLVGRDEAAFAAIVERHGPMVWSVCRHLVPDEHDAEDAFQTVFLVLARRARDLRDRDALGPWLHGVATRVAMRVRANAARRRGRERPVLAAVEPAAPDPTVARIELREILDREIDRLPEKFRRPIVLCDLQGRTHEEAARELRWTPGMVRGRLNRGRARLRGQLLRRGVAPAVATSAGAVNAGASVPPALAAATVCAASAGAFSDMVVTLAHGLQPRGWLVRPLALGTGALAVGAILIAAAAGGPSAADRGAMATPSQPPRGNHVAKPAEPPAEAAPPTRRRRPFEPEVRTIHVTGRARDHQGKPVAGATVRLTDANRRSAAGAALLLATTTTDKEGRFVLHDAALPVWVPDAGPVPKPTEGRFQVSGTALGFGWAWDDVRSFRPEPRPAKADPEDVRGAFYKGEPIVVDLVFAPPARLHGRLTDDRGNPVGGAKVQVGVIDDARGVMWTCAALDPNGGEPRQFDGVRALPESLRTTRSDANGDYQLEDLPRDASLVALLDAGPAVQAESLTIATADRAPLGSKAVGYDGSLGHAFAWWRTVRVRIMRPDGKPLEASVDATVTARGDQLQRDGAIGNCDGTGQALLRLPPGHFTLAVQPAIGARWLPRTKSIEVAKEPPDQTFDVALEPGAQVTLEAIDATNHTGVPGVTFTFDTDTTRDRRALNSTPALVDHPATGTDGRLVAVVAPGARRFFADRVPAGYTVAGQDTLRQLAPGSETVIRFTLRGQPSQDALFPGPETALRVRLHASWRRQDERCGWTHFAALRAWQPAEGIAPDALRALLDGLDRASVPNVAKRIAAAFPDAAPVREGHYDVVVGEGGRKVRERVVWPDGSANALPDMVVSNGAEQFRYTAGNRQVDIFANTRLGTLSLRDFSRYTLASERLAQRPKGDSRPPSIHLQHAGKWTTIEVVDAPVTMRTVVDATTGFIVRQALSDVGGTDESWQFGPRKYPNGVTLPRVSVHVRAAGGEVTQCEILTLESVEFDPPVEPNTFVGAVPPGTIILDYRDAGRAPSGRTSGPGNTAYRGMTTGPVLDVIAYADAIAARRRPAEPPRVAAGDVAPPLWPATWINGVAPDLGGKVVLIDFWGTTCGPCVAELPEVREAVRHFAGSDLVIVGLHDDSGNAETIGEFARKRQLNYPIAIDRPVFQDAPGFGATFEDYGVRAIPAAAVIDRDGRVAFVGRFQDALTKAADLIRRKPK